MADADSSTGTRASDFFALERLEEIRQAYVGLEVLAGVADLDSHHVAAVMRFVNLAFDDLLVDLRKPSTQPVLRLVD